MPLGWVAGAMAVGTVYTANKASKASGEATRTAGEAASNQLALDAETLDFYKQQYADQKPIQERAAATAERVSNAQLKSMEMNDGISKDYYDYARGTFRPVEQGLVTDAQNYDTQAKRDEKAAQAVADVGMQAEMQRQAQTRSLQRAGVAPGSGKAMAIQSQAGLAEATAKAGAAGAARNQVETQGWARRMDAASLGRNLPSNQATSAGIAINAGNSAVTNARSPIQDIGSMTATMGQGFNQVSQGNQRAYDSIINAQNNTAQMWGSASSSLASGAGSMAGMYFAKKP